MRTPDCFNPLDHVNQHAKNVIPCNEVLKTMKQQLWIANSALLAILLFIVGIGIFLQQEAPKFRARRHIAKTRHPTKQLKDEEVETIYKYDLFGTFIKKAFAPAQQQLVTPMPQPPRVTKPTAPVEPTIEFMPPLTLTLKGIAFSSDEKKSIGIIEDETKKEHVYHVGDGIKDAQLIKIGQNRISLLRTNGQHETFFLRKEENIDLMAAKKSWAHLVKKIDATTFEIDSTKFAHEIPTIGLFSEMLSLVTAYKQGKPIGIKIANQAPNSIGSSIGLKKHDIITQVNGMNTADKKTRMKIYDTVTRLKQGSTITVTLTRNGQPITLSYSLGKIKNGDSRVFTPTADDKPAPATPPTFTLSKLQENEKKRRNFAKKHQGEQQSVINEIRKRLLEGIQARMRNTRIR